MRPYRIRRNTPDDIWKNVAKADGCWLWMGLRSRDGYGRARYQDKYWRAHRLVWALSGNELPPGMHVCHHCDNPACCNPAHLFLGTDLDNARDKISKGRMVILYGEANGRSKLTMVQVEAMRLEYASGKVTYEDLGKKYGLDGSQARRAVKGISWRPIPEEAHHERLPVGDVPKLRGIVIEL